MPPPMTSPFSARSVEMAAWVRSVPLRRLSQKAVATALGAGSRRVDISSAARGDLPDDHEADRQRP